MDVDTTERERWRIAGLVVAVFAVVGVGLGLTGLVGLSWVTSRVGDGALGVGQVITTLAFLQSTVVTLLIGPTVGGVVGTLVGNGGEGGDARERALASGVGCFFGFYVLAGLALFLMSLALGGGDGGGANLGDLVVPVVEAGVPTALVGAAAALLGARL